jgi:hypothetical protein
MSFSMELFARSPFRFGYRRWEGKKRSLYMYIRYIEALARVPLFLCLVLFIKIPFRCTYPNSLGLKTKEEPRNDQRTPNHQKVLFLKIDILKRLTQILIILTNFWSLHLLLVVDSQTPTFQQGDNLYPTWNSICTSNSNLFLQMHNFFSPLPQFGTEAHYLCAKFHHTMPHHSPSLPPISHFGVSRGFDFLLMPPGGTA